MSRMEGPVSDLLSEYRDIPYASWQPRSPSHMFDLFVPKEIQGSDSLYPLICFVHGGAWRSEDKSDHAGLARQLALSTKYPVAVPNYRLTPKEPTQENILRHPEHAKDILSFLEFICGNNSATSPDDSCIATGLHYQPRQLFLLGHSCSAHMLCSIFLNMPSFPGAERLHPSAEVLERTKALVLSEGIYDIDALLARFPSYRQWFIEAAFGARDSYADFAATAAAVRPEGGHIRWQIIHSSGDTIVDKKQSETMHAHLAEKSAQVSTSFDKLLDGHNEILKGDDYVRIVRDHIVTGST